MNHLYVTVTVDRGVVWVREQIMQYILGYGGK